MKFNIGDRVVLNDHNLKNYDEQGMDCTKGVVHDTKETLHDGCEKVLVKWDISWGPPLQEIDASQLVPEKEANQMIATMEAEFEAWAIPAREKMKQAADLLLEAGNLAEMHNREINQMHDIVYPLLTAMDSLGWRTSGLSC
jgi:hypothetical protein